MSFLNSLSLRWSSDATRWRSDFDRFLMNLKPLTRFATARNNILGFDGDRNNIAEENSLHYLFASQLQEVPNYAPGTCEWITKVAEYQTWISKDTSAKALLIYADAGRGKTVLAKFINDKLQSEHGSHWTLTFFCQSKLRGRNSIVAVLASFIYYVATSHRESLQSEESFVQRLPSDWTRQDEAAIIGNLWEIFLDLNNYPFFADYTFIIDGLDQCDESSQNIFRNRLMSSAEVLHAAVLVTTRPGKNASLVQVVPTISINPERSSSDLKIYVNYELTKRHIVKQMSQELEKLITDAILEKAEGLFLLCSCRLDAIEKWASDSARINTPSEIKRVLQQPFKPIENYFLSLTDGLVHSKRQQFGIDMLNIMLAGTAQRTNQELTFAYTLATSTGITSLQAYENSDKPSLIVWDAQTVCGPILGSRIHTASVSEDPKLYLAHPLIEELFKSSSSLQLTDQQRSCLNQINEPRGQAMMAKACLSYLMFSDFPESSAPDYKDLPFLVYALHNWPVHLRESKEKFSDLTPLLKEFFAEDSRGFELWDRWCSRAVNKTEPNLTRRPLAVVLAEQSLPNLVEKIERSGRTWTIPGIVSEIDLDQKYDGYTGLHVALAGDDFLNATRFLELGADPRLTTTQGITALHLAVACRSEALIRLCHQKGADLDAETDHPNDHNGKGLFGESPLFWSLSPEGSSRTKEFDLLYSLGARRLTRKKLRTSLLTIVASQGDLDFVKYLVENKIQTPDIRAADGATPLIDACRSVKGLQAVDYLIRVGGADVSAVDDNGQTALTMALHCKREENARHLLQLEAFLNKDMLDKKGIDGYTALHWATINHYTTLVEIIIDNGATVDCRTDDGCTPLLIATRKKYTDLVRLLLKAGADPDAADNSGHGPLYDVCDYQFHEIAEALILAKAQGVKEKVGVNCFHVVGMRNYVSIAKMLLASSLRDTDLLDTPAADVQWTPLMASLHYDHYDVAKLFARQDVDFTRTDRDGRSVLHMACATNDIEVFEQILSRTPEHLIDARSTGGHTPLRVAASKGFYAAVKVLLQRGCDVASIDNSDQTPLIAASRSKSYETLQLILGEKNCLPDKRDDNGWKALDYAATDCKDASLLKELMSRTNWQYRTGVSVNPLGAAVCHCNLVALQTFLENGMSPDLLSSNGSTALFEAVEIEDGRMTELLVKHGASLTVTGGCNVYPWVCAFDSSSHNAIELLRPNSAEGLGRKASTNFVNAIAQAAKASLKDVVWLVDNYIDPTVHSIDGSTALHNAAFHRQADVLRYLLKQPGMRALVNSKTRNKLETPLHFAACTRSTDCIRALIEAGADVDVIDFCGRSPLDYVLSYGEDRPQIMDEECFALLAPTGPPSYSSTGPTSNDPSPVRVKGGVPQIRALLKELTDLKPDDYFFDRRERDAISMLGQMFLSIKDFTNALTVYEYGYGRPSSDYVGFIDCHCCAKGKGYTIGYLCKTCTCVSICPDCKKDIPRLREFGCGDHELLKYPRDSWLTRSSKHVNEEKQTKEEWLESLNDKFNSDAESQQTTALPVLQWDYASDRTNVFELLSAGRWHELREHLTRYPTDVARVDDQGDDMVMSTIRTATSDEKCLAALEKLAFEGARLLVYNGQATSLNLACERRFRKVTELLLGQHDSRFDKREENSPSPAMSVMIDQDWQENIKLAIERHFSWLIRGPYEELKNMAASHQPIDDIINMLKSKRNEILTEPKDEVKSD